MTAALDWPGIAARSLRGEGVTREEALAILRLPDPAVLEALMAAYEVRRAHFGNRVKICVLQNARSGLCPEDCHYCSQSRVSKADIDKYGLLSADTLLQGARRAEEAGAVRYCMVTSGRGPTDADIDRLCEVARAISARHRLELCVSLGIMTEAQARRLKDAGIGWVNHNLNTSERYHPEICTTHSYEDRVRTVENVRRAGLATCSGGIIGMGETDEDIVELAFAVRRMRMDSIPINFLHPIRGTPLEAYRFLTPSKCLKVLALMRLMNPDSEIRAAGGREVNLRSLQPLALYAANSIFVEGYLTTPGQQAEEARRMIEDMGFEVEAGTSQPHPQRHSAPLVPNSELGIRNSE
ncbi:MAG TPA: biotin synthase BioB [bacterium]